MQPLNRLRFWLIQNQKHRVGLYTFGDFKPLFSDYSEEALKTLLSRAAGAGILEKICRGVFFDPKSVNDGLLLFHVANLLRADKFNYISLETVLSDAGVISQMPINNITIMSSARSNIIKCNNYGVIEFVHTAQKPNKIMHELIYDGRCKMWRASVKLALRDMKITRRNLNLIDENTLNDFI